MLKRALLSSALLGLVLSIPATSYATPVLTFDAATGLSGLNQDQSVGWQFNVISDITVTGLSWYDEGANGLTTSHTVGIWDPSGNLLASVLIPAGTGSTLDGQFRTVSIAPLLLTAGSGYIVGGENFFSNTERLAFNVTQTLIPELAFVDATFSDIGTGFTRPTSLSSATTGFYGPSFAVTAVAPEPATLLLLGTGLVGAGVRRWRQTRA